MAAGGAVLLIINDDVQLTCTGLFDRLLKLYEDRPALGVCYGNLSGEWQVQDAPEAPEWQGACWAIRHSAFQAMGGLEESLNTYGGDELVTRTRMKRLDYDGARLRGWTYEHELHATYGAEATSLQHMHQVAAALGFGSLPARLTTEQCERICDEFLQDEGFVQYQLSRYEKR